MMPVPNLFQETKQLGVIIGQLAERPHWLWLYIANTETKISLNTLCFPTATDSRDLSEEEIVEFEAYADRAGLCAFLNRDQLQDIIENLRQQRAGYTPQQLATAIDFYWRHDAFIDLSSPKA